MRTWLSCLSAWFSLLAIAACGGGDPGRGTEPPPRDSKPTGMTAVAGPTAFEGSFDVGGHELYVTCRGSGPPTVVYLHGYGTSGSSAGLVPDLLMKRRRVCVYDRANTGRSELVDGRQTGTDSVRDLRALLAAADIPGPYVLLGSSLGGLIAGMYAATYPDDVIGMVLLDSTLPDEPELARFIPRSDHLGPDDWKGTSERFDRLASFEQAQGLAGSEPAIPVTYLASDPLDVPPSWPVERMTVAVRRMQRDYIRRFSPGRLVLIATPHQMEPLIPGRIAREVERVISSAPGG